MKFIQRHPYLFWQIVGWSLFAADFLFLVIAALNDFGEWCYPVIVFTFLGALFAVAASPVIVWFARRKEVPQSTDANSDKAIRVRIAQLNTARHGAKGEVFTAILAFLSIFVFMGAAFYLGEYVHLALGLAAMILALIAPFLIIGFSSKIVTKRFFTVQNGEKLIDLIAPPDLKQLGIEDPPTFVICGEPNSVLLNFFYNWLRFYMREERLTMYRVTAQELCRDYQPSEFLSYGDVLLCIPMAQFDLANDKEALFYTECSIMRVIGFSFLAVSPDAETDDDE